MGRGVTIFEEWNGTQGKSAGLMRFERARALSYRIVTTIVWTQRMPAMLSQPLHERSSQPDAPRNLCQQHIFPSVFSLDSTVLHTQN